MLAIEDSCGEEQSLANKFLQKQQKTGTIVLQAKNRRSDACAGGDAGDARLLGGPDANARRMR